MLTNLLLLFFSLLVLTAGAEILVRGAASLALRFGMSSFVVGITIVGFGTSTPELATSVKAGVDGLADIALGNIVGSNIFNIAIVLGLTALIAPIAIDMKTIRNQVLIMIAVAFTPFLALLAGGVLTRPIGAIFFVGLIAMLYYSYRTGRASGEEADPPVHISPGSRWAQPWFCVAAAAVGVVLLVWGADMLVRSSVAIARTLGISELVIGLTIVSAGTSAPELFTSLVAALRRQQSIALGNVVGSNIFNILGIGGITALVYPQTVNRQILMLDAPLMAALSVACLPVMFTGRRISRTEGAVFLAVYGGYLFVLFQYAPGWFAANPQ